MQKNKKKAKKKEIKEIVPIIEPTETLEKRKKKYNQLYGKAKTFFEAHYKDKFKDFQAAFDGGLGVDGQAQWRNTINIPTASSTVRTELVRVKKGLFNDPTGNFWGLQPIEWTEEHQRIADVFGFILEKQKSNGHWGYHLNLIAQDSLIYGVGWAKVDWKREEVVTSYYDQIKKEIVKIEQKQTLVDGNVIVRKDPMKIYPDPKALCYWDCRYVCEDVMVTREEIEENEGDIFNEAAEYKVLLEKLNQRKDEDEFQGYYIYMRDKTILFVEGLLVIDQPNIYAHGMLPVLPMIKIADGNSVIGVGIIQRIFDLCQWQNLLYNAAADSLEMVVAKMIVHEDTDPLTSQNLEWSSGKEIKVHPGEKITPLDMGTIPQAYFEEMKDMRGLFNDAVGNLDVLNAPEGMGQGQNTLGGMNMVLNEANMVFADDITQNKENFILPLVRMLHLNCKQFMKPKEMTEVLSEDKLEALGLKDGEMDLDVDFNYLAVGDSSLETEQTKMMKLLSLLPILMQVEQAKQNPDLIAIFNFDEWIKFILLTYKIPREMLKKQLEKFGEDEQQPQPNPIQSPQDIIQKATELAQKYNVSPVLIAQMLTQGLGFIAIEQKLQQGAQHPQPPAAQASPTAQIPQTAATNVNVVAPVGR
jgi:hypothetical protein